MFSVQTYRVAQYLLLFLVSTLAMKEQLREIRDPTLTTKVNLNWLKSQTKWFLPLLTPFKIWKFCLDSHDEHFCRKSTEKQIMEQGCLYWTPPTNTSIFGKFLKYDQAILDNEILWRKQGTTGAFRHFRFAFTDNQSFVLGLNEWEGGKICWMLLSIEKTLPHQTVQKIKHFIEAFGFQEKLILVNSADNCKEYDESVPYD